MKKYLKTPEEVIDALQAEKKVETENLEYKFINGILVAIGKTDKNWIVYPALSSSVIPYINETEPITLEVGKFYMTREGKKVIILADNCKPKDSPYLVAEIGKCSTLYAIRKNGCIYEKGANACDIIAPWKD